MKKSQLELADALMECQRLKQEQLERSTCQNQELETKESRLIQLTKESAFVAVIKQIEIKLWDILHILQ